MYTYLYITHMDSIIFYIGEKDLLYICIFTRELININVFFKLSIIIIINYTVCK